MKIITVVLIICMYCVSCQQGKNISNINIPNPSQEEFWNQLQALCGKSYYGKVIEAPATDTVFRNKELVLHIRSCASNRIRTPFIVGSNRSRTFIFTKFITGLQLKHDHRHQDGVPDSITMYGGFTNNSGSSSMQIFPADQHTVNILPAAAGNVWWVEIKKDSYIRYNLRRIGTERLFIVEFDLNSPAPTPLPPWGWME